MVAIPGFRAGARTQVGRTVKGCLIAAFLIGGLPLTGATSAAASPLYGPNAQANTQGMVDATVYPWSAIGRLNIAGHTYCTGVMISDRHLLTQANCLYNKNENRWWDASELHYRAGYQYDDHIAASRVLRFEVSERFDPQHPKSLASVANDWALITLKRPLGETTGWLAVKKMTSTLMDKLRQGQAKLLNAGYHNGWEHALRISKGCRSNSDGGTLPGVGTVPCRGPLVSQHALPKLYYENGVYTLVSSQVFSSHTHPKGNDSRTFASLKNARRAWGENRMPQ